MLHTNNVNGREMDRVFEITCNEEVEVHFLRLMCRARSLTLRLFEQSGYGSRRQRILNIPGRT